MVETFRVITREGFEHILVKIGWNENARNPVFFQSKSTWQFCDCDLMVISVTFSEVVTVSSKWGDTKVTPWITWQGGISGPYNGFVFFFQIGIAGTYDEIHPDLRRSVLIATRCVFPPFSGVPLHVKGQENIDFSWNLVVQFESIWQGIFSWNCCTSPKKPFEPGKCPIEYILNKVSKP